MSENGSASGVPDLLGREGRVQTVAGVLRQVQQRLFYLEAEQISEGLADTDPAPGFAEKTVAELRGELRENERRIASHYEELMPEITALLRSG